MENERLIWAAARLLLEKHGERAQAIAAQRAQARIERQDGAAALLWLSISDAVKDLETATAPRARRLSFLDLLAGPTARQMTPARNVEDEEVIRLMQNAKRQRRD